MIGFVEYLISKGYKPYRKVMSKKGSTYVEDSNIGFYSSMSEHIDLRLIKGKKEVVYGLHERGTSKAIRHCLNCGKELDYSAKKYCSNDCQAQYEYSSYIERWRRVRKCQQVWNI